MQFASGQNPGDASAATIGVEVTWVHIRENPPWSAGRLSVSESTTRTSVSKVGFRGKSTLSDT
ncbi:MAG: hypothetical protein KDA75_12105, partial [Planctomycetaceae bacterium]|nr:hypothetical protein [Planctomycetaceae bacterium]